jgi:hypothetical protein
MLRKPLSWHGCQRAMAAVLAYAWLGVLPAMAATNPENELGDWLIWNGTVRVADRWSVFTEAQLRLWEVASNVNEVFVRAAGQYHTSANSLVALGYMRSRVEPFADSEETTEDRIYEQFSLKNRWERPVVEHRFRLEQRWVEEADVTNYKNRLRYRLQITLPLNQPTMGPGAHFLNFYDELFLNFGSNKTDTFDQNRLYGAYGWQFTEQANLQLGLLWKATKRQDFWRLQIFYTHNFDLRKR